MAQPWQTIEKANTPDGLLELRRRGERDFLILINNRVLMNSSASRSELALGELACREIAARSRPRVLIGGLGMGLTLRAALDSLPETALVTIVEINRAIIEWCRGALAELNGNALGDPRITIVHADVAAVIEKAAGSRSEPFDAVIIDLYEGPHAGTDSVLDPFYGSRALKRTAAVLSSGGVFAVWGENPDAGFEKRLQSAGFQFERQRPGRGGLRHVVYLARKL